MDGTIRQRKFADRQREAGKQIVKVWVPGHVVKALAEKAAAAKAESRSAYIVQMLEEIAS